MPFFYCVVLFNYLKSPLQAIFKTFFFI
ncbi:MAG: hypothetical protein ACJA1X_001784, partial [Bermanella sp.]